MMQLRKVFKASKMISITWRDFLYLSGKVNVIPKHPVKKYPNNPVYISDKSRIQS